jgi:hypothetical protein
VLPHEAGPLGPLVVRAEDGTLRIPMTGPACGALRADRACGVYEVRPSVCHLYPYQVHAGRRIQATVSLGCPGIAEAHALHPAQAHPFGVDKRAEDGATRAIALALAQPGAQEQAARAKQTFVEFDRRMKEWGVHATSDKLRSAFVPRLESFARPELLPALFAGLSEGDLLLDDPGAVAALFETEPQADLEDLLVEGAADAFDEPDTVIWVEADHAWTQARAEAGEVVLTRTPGGERRLAVDALPTAWTDEARDALAAYLARLCGRDQTEGAAAWLVDASGYQATLPAAYARVLGEASLQVALRAGLLAAEEGAPEITLALARRGVAAYETSYHSLPTLGAIL